MQKLDQHDSDSVAMRHAGLFRRAAINRYIIGDQDPVLLRLVTPKAFLLLWVIVGLLFVGVSIGWLCKVPVLQPGLAIMIHCPKQARQVSSAKLCAAVLSPSKRLTNPKPGDSFSGRLKGSDVILQGTIKSVEPYPSSVTDIRRRYPSMTTSGEVTTPQSISIATVDLSSTEGTPDQYLGSLVNVTLQTGSERVMHLIWQLINRK